MRTTRIAIAGIVGAVLALSACAPEQSAPESSDNFPDKPIEFVVPFDPGGGTDLTARVIAEALSNELDVPVNVVNKPGAETIVGVDYVRKARSDGYTLLADGAASSSILSFNKKAPFKWDDRTFIGRVTAGPHAFAVPADSPYKTFDDLLTALKKDPGSFHIGWSGGATTSDLTTLSLLQAAGVKLDDLKTVDFTSSGETMEAVAGGDLDLGVGGASATFSLLSSKNLRVLAQTGTEPLKQFPGVPTTADAGHPEIDVTYWVGVSGPANLPDSVKKRLAEALATIADTPDTADSFTNVGVVSDPLSGSEFEDYVRSEVTTFKTLRKLIGG